MKYIDADKIRTEIKRLKAENNCGTDEFIAAKDIAYDKVFDFLEILEEPVTDCHDLKEAAEDFVWRVMEDDENGISDLCRKLRPTSKISDFYDALGEFFKAGAEWMKTKMMEGAVEGSCLDDLTAGSVIDTEYGVLYLPPDKFCVGDKVKIIIVKEDAE